MIFIFQKVRAISYKLKAKKLNRGMTYVELIVVLSIFAGVTTIVLFNFQGFQSKVDIKNLSSDVALKIVEASKSALSGVLPPLVQLPLVPPNWKPSYGVYFSVNPSIENKNIVYFVDLNSDKIYDLSSCPGSGECLDRVSITRGNYVSNLNVLYQGDATAYPLQNLTISFTRPNSSANIIATPSLVPDVVVDYVEIITASSSGAVSAKIKVYPSGRLQID